jgi:hypothetical protein
LFGEDDEEVKYSAPIVTAPTVNMIFEEEKQPLLMAPPVYMAHLPRYDEPPVMFEYASTDHKPNHKNYDPT